MNARHSRCHWHDSGATTVPVARALTATDFKSDSAQLSLEAPWHGIGDAVTVNLKSESF
jgi:hypothetical protein